MRQFLVANAEFGENGEMARELQSKLSNFLDSVQVKRPCRGEAPVWGGVVTV